MARKPKEKLEFSKKIFIIVITILIVVIAYSMALMWKTDNTDGLNVLIPSVFTLANVCIGFYFWKAKMENVIKLSKENNMTIDEVKELEEDIDDYEVDFNESEDY